MNSQPLYGQAAAEVGDRLRTRHAAVQALLHVMADQLTGRDPAQSLTDGVRLALIHDMTGSIGPLSSALLDWAPPITRPTTTGEYVLILRRSAGGQR